LDEPAPDRPAPPKKRTSDPNAGRNKLNWLARVCIDPNLSHMARTAATILCTRYMHADRGMVAWPAMATLAADLGVQARAASRAVRELVDAGYLIREERPGATARFRIAKSDAETDRKCPKFGGEATRDPRPAKQGAPDEVGLPDEAGVREMSAVSHPAWRGTAPPFGEAGPPCLARQTNTGEVSTGEGTPGNIKRASAALGLASDDLFGSTPPSEQAAVAGARSPKATRKARKADDDQISAMLWKIAAVYPEGPYVPARDNLAGWRRSAGALRSALKDDSFENILAGAKAFGARNPDQQFVPRPTNWLQRQDWRGELKRPQRSQQAVGNGRSIGPDPVQQIQRQRAQIREQASAAAAAADRFEAPR